jgi:hypothetical protein
LPAERGCCSSALVIHEKVLGPEHPQTAAVRSNLLALCQAE